jgi:peptidoglycan hydrolase-like protein with peptidoglycan-binding domain
MTGRRPVRIDGALSNGTARAVRAYQRKTGLPVTGVVSDEVWAGLLSGR